MRNGALAPRFFMILILSSRLDVHAVAAATVLRRQGNVCVVLNQEDFPESLAISVDPAVTGVVYGKGGEEFPLSSFRTVWNRRWSVPQPPAFLSPQDQDLSYRASKRLLDWLNLFKCPDQLWINDPWKAIEAANKLVQLRIAREVGFAVPETIVTNHPDTARRFVASGSSIVKPILPMSWDDGAHRVAVARTVTIDQMASDRAIAACPMIYQRHVRKQCDLRIVVFGSEILAVRIDSQRREDTAVDFRAGDYFDLVVEQVDLNSDTRRRIARFMSVSGLLHASFDLVISAEGDFVFLEVNQQGQMTWIEDRNPSIRVLDRLCGFLLAPSQDYRWNGAEKYPFEQFRELVSDNESDPFSERGITVTGDYGDGNRKSPPPAPNSKNPVLQPPV